jgi:hypothetical protein
MIEYISAAVATVQTALLVLVTRGFFPLIRQKTDSAIYHLSIGVTAILLALAVRAFYWDALRVLTGPEAWLAFATAVGRPIPNTVFGLVVIYGLWHMLCLLHTLIPAEDRKDYSVWTAPFYPRRRGSPKE